MGFLAPLLPTGLACSVPIPSRGPSPSIGFLLRPVALPKPIRILVPRLGPITGKALHPFV